MSYSFTTRAASKAAALLAISAKLDELVTQQPVHEVDRRQVQQVADAMVSLLPDDDSRDVAVSISGYVSGSWNGPALLALGTVAVSVNAALMSRNTQG